MPETFDDESNRRKSNRRSVYGHNAFAMLSTDNEKIPVLIINESIGGIGVVAVNPPSLPSGGVIRFESAIRHTDSRIASIKYMKFTDAVVCRIGLEWTD
jgi:hypothetical protein